MRNFPTTRLLEEINYLEAKNAKIMQTSKDKADAVNETLTKLLDALKS